MIRVFIGGSRQSGQLNNMIKERFKNIINNKYQVLLGDANGADKAVQMFLYEMNYKNVLVFCSGEYCRNNLGNWKVVNVAVPSNVRGSKFYMVKDARMAENADYGFMLWDGKSPGTLNNILNLLLRKKKTLLYYFPEKSFYTIARLEDIEWLLAKCEANEILRFEMGLNLSKVKEKLKNSERMSYST